MRPIGGYFESEDIGRECLFPLPGARLNTARNSLQYLLGQLHNLRCVYIPFYTCEVVLEPLRHLNLDVRFYHIDASMELADEIHLGAGEILIANNYFGLKDSYMLSLTEKYGGRLIIDNAQAMFSPVIPGTMAVYSMRKYVGVADGGIAFGADDALCGRYAYDDSTEHNSHLAIRKEKGAEAGYPFFQANEQKLSGKPVMRMSPDTEYALKHLDYGEIKSKRKNNFNYLHEALSRSNKFKLPQEDNYSCPMVYPYLCEDQGLRQRLLDNKIYVARYWPNVLEWCGVNDLEYKLALNLLPLPIDQRYGSEDMKKVINIILNG